MAKGDKGLQFLPYRDLFENISKAALADIAWNLAAALASSADDRRAVLAVFAREASVTLAYRKDSIPDRIRTCEVER